MLTFTKKSFSPTNTKVTSQTNFLQTMNGVKLYVEEVDSFPDDYYSEESLAGIAMRDRARGDREQEEDEPKEQSVVLSIRRLNERKKKKKKRRERNLDKSSPLVSGAAVVEEELWNNSSEREPDHEECGDEEAIAGLQVVANAKGKRKKNARGRKERQAKLISDLFSVIDAKKEVIQVRRRRRTSCFAR